MNIRFFRSILATGAALSTAACVDLDVTNPNNPDSSQALGTPAVVAALATSSVNSWYLAATHYEGTHMMQVTADASTANYGNFGMRFNNEEPRIPYNNNSASGDEPAARVMYNGYYSALSAANDVLLAFDLGLDFGTVAENERIRSTALFTQAATLSGLALQYDQGFPTTRPPVTAADAAIQPYTVMLDTARLAWDRVIALTSGKTWGWDVDWMPVTDVTLNAAGQIPASIVTRIARTMAARTLVLGARTGAQNTGTAAKWAAVLAYADAGITGTGLTDMDFALTYDGQVWYDYIKLYGNLDNWTRVDQRLINRMDPTVPVKFNGAANQAANINATTLDDRLADANGTCGASLNTCLVGNTQDYINVRTVIGDPGRGIWMQSTFYHRRWRGVSFNTPNASRIGRPMAYVLAAENDLMIAEALARTGGDLTRAAALVNKTRVTRGGLAAVAADAAAILAAVDYERDVELLNTSALSLFDARRFERIQVGTFRHMPMPARELEILGRPVYTFGGAAENPTGM